MKIFFLKITISEVCVPYIDTTIAVAIILGLELTMEFQISENVLVKNGCG